MVKRRKKIIRNKVWCRTLYIKKPISKTTVKRDALKKLS